MSKATLFQNLLKATSIDTITPAMILQAGAPIFFDLANNPDLKAISTVVNAYRGVHAPLYGQPIPRSGLSSNRTGAGTVITPTGNEVYRIMGVNFLNNGGAPVILDLGLGGVVIQSTITVNPTETLVATLPSTIFCDSESHLYVTVLSGDGSLLVTSVASMLTSQ